MKFKLITKPMDYRDPYAHALTEGQIEAIKAQAGDWGKTIQVVSRTVSWPRTIATLGVFDPSCVIKEMVFDVSREDLPAVNEALGLAIKDFHRAFALERWHPLANDIVALLKKHGLRETGIQDAQVMFQTRDHGNVGEERAGQQDIDTAKRGMKVLKDAYPDLPVQLDIVDEWVLLIVDMADIEEFAVRAADSHIPPPSM